MKIFLAHQLKLGLFGKKVKIATVQLIIILKKDLEVKEIKIYLFILKMEQFIFQNQIYLQKVLIDLEEKFLHILCLMINQLILIVFRILKRLKKYLTLKIKNSYEKK